MSMHEYGVSGFGFTFDSVKWKKQFENDYSKIREYIEDNITPNSCVDSAYGNYLGDMCIIYDTRAWGEPWHEDLKKIKSDDDAREYFWNLFKDLVDTPEQDFKSQIDDLEDVYVS